MAKQGSLSINSENIFPIIKKWLYSDHDIFIRELVSNGCDAVTKLKKLSVMGEFEEADDEKYKVEVRINPTDKTLTFIDNGIGMTEDEVDEYINQIAFSGAAAFMEQYKDKASDEQIIGHFGLGFYSAFMVADKVTIDTLSYKEGATPVHWECDGGTEFDMEDGDKAERGTTITLYLNDESYEFCNEYRCREVLNKYCSFMPVEIYFVNEEEEAKKTARIVGLAAIKYGDLSNQAGKDYIFDVDRFTSFEGNTGPYILYTIVRIKSILAKYKENGGSAEKLSIRPSGNVYEKALMLQVLKFNDVFEAVCEETAPHKLCAYIYEIANEFNKFYHETKILSEEDEEKRSGYIALLGLTKRVLETCIDLLGFEAPERM